MRSIIAECKCKNAKTLFQEKDVRYRMPCSHFIKDLPKLRKEYRKSRTGPEIPIADEKRMGILEDFIDVLESAKSSDELVDTLQSILGVEEDIGAVCLC